MRSICTCVISLLLIVSKTTGSYLDIHLCNKTLESANASGIFTYHVEYPKSGNGNAMVPDPSWAITIDEHNDDLQTNLWYNTAGQNYSNDLAIGYDACAYYITGLPLNTVELGQDDPGDCSAMFSDQCRTAILDRASKSAYGLVSNPSPPPYSNLSAGDIGFICGEIIDAVGDNGLDFPQECAQEFGYNPATLRFEATTTIAALTDYNSSGLTMQCPLQIGDKTYYNAHGPMVASSGAYDNRTREVYPILTVYMPVANWDYYGAKGSIAPSKLTCARVKQFSEGSRVSPALPSGTPYKYGHGLSKGAIAGIVVGIVVFAAIVVGLLAYFFIRRRMRQNQRQLQEVESRSIEEKLQLDGAEVVELTTVDQKYEPDSKSHVAEMGEAQGKPAELGA